MDIVKLLLSIIWKIVAAEDRYVQIQGQKRVKTRTWHRRFTFRKKKSRGYNTWLPSKNLMTKTMVWIPAMHSPCLNYNKKRIEQKAAAKKFRTIRRLINDDRQMFFIVKETWGYTPRVKVIKRGNKELIKKLAAQITVEMVESAFDEIDHMSPAKRSYFAERGKMPSYLPISVDDDVNAVYKQRLEELKRRDGYHRVRRSSIHRGGTRRRIANGFLDGPGERICWWDDMPREWLSAAEIRRKKERKRQAKQRRAERKAKTKLRSNQLFQDMIYDTMVETIKSN